MKRNLLFLLTFILSLFGLHGQGKDFIFLLETSNNLSQSYDALVQSFFSPVINNHFQRGDQFHLYGFDASTSFLFSRRVNSQRDLDLIRGQFRQIRPLQNYSDLIQSLDDVYSDLIALDQSTPKSIIWLTYGSHRPVESSPYQIQGKDLSERIEGLFNALLQLNYDVSILWIGDVPKEELTEGHPTYPLFLASTNSQIPFIPYDAGNPELTYKVLRDPILTWPNSFTVLNRKDQILVDISNISDTTYDFRIRSLQFQGQEILLRQPKIILSPFEQKTFSLPVEFNKDFEKGNLEGQFSLEIDGPTRPSPLHWNTSFELKDGVNLFSNNWSFLAFLLLIGLITFGIIKISQYLKNFEPHPLTLDSSSTPKIVHQPSIVSKLSKEDSKGIPAPYSSHHSKSRFFEDPEETLRIYLDLSDQQGLLQKNPYKSNNVKLREGQVRRIGPPPSDLLITLYPFQKAVAQIQWADSKLVFTPLDYSLFPHLNGPIEDALGQSIQLVHSQSILTIRLGIYQNPLRQLNELLAKGRLP